MRIAVLLLFSACGPTVTVPEGVVGKEAEVVFQAENDLLLQERTRLVVGSAFDVVAVPRIDADLGGAMFASSDEGVLKVTAADVGEGRVEVIGAGDATLLVRGANGTDVDGVDVRAAVPETRSMVEAQLLGGSIDARLPSEFAVVLDEEVDVFVAAVDRCGGELLDWGAAAATSSDDAVLIVEAHEAAGFVLRPIAVGDAVVSFTTPEEDAPLTYEVRVLEAELVDDVVPTAAAASENSVELWGRAFAGSDEVVGLTYGWDATTRVSVSPARGPTTVATIAGVGEGAEPVEGDAIVTASALDEEGDLNLLALLDTDLVTGRVAGAAPPAADVQAQSTGCGGGAPAPCDPAAAVVALAGVGAMRRRRREPRPNRT